MENVDSSGSSNFDDEFGHGNFDLKLGNVYDGVKLNVDLLRYLS